MIKVLIWRVSNDTTFQDNALKILERQHDGIEVAASSTGEDIGKVDWGGAYDILLVVGAKEMWSNAKMSKAIQDAKQFNLPEEKLLGDWIVCIPGFTLEKYRELQNARLSIISRSCFGGIISNRLALPFRSPFINLHLSEKDFSRLLLNPRAYMEKDLVFAKKDYREYSGFDVATYACGDISLIMEHYRDFDEAVTKWNERKKKINWDNLLIATITESPEVLREFDTLPYDKKVCFVPFKSDLKSAFYIPDTGKGTKWIWHIVHRSVAEMKFYYDPFDMLLYGKKTPLIEM